MTTKSERWVITLLDEDDSVMFEHYMERSEQARQIVQDYIMRGYAFKVTYQKFECGAWIKKG